MKQKRSFHILEKYKYVLCLHGEKSIDFINELLKKNIKKNTILVFFNDCIENIEIKNYCKKNEINYIDECINKKENIVREYKPDILLSIYYRNIINKKILDLVSINSINYHPSILPKNRGCFSSAWEIISGENLSGYTFHIMNQNIDDGKIIIQETFPLLKKYTAIDLYKIKHQLALLKINEMLEYVLNGNDGYEQEEIAKSYHGRELPYGGEIDPNKHTYELSERIVRAYIFDGKPPVNIKILNKLLPISNTDELEKYKFLFR